MIVDERIVTYMHSLEKPNNSVLEEIEQQAHIDGVPIIRKEMESFLRVMLTITKPKRILELGTAVGYSAILMSEAIEKDASIITIENYEKRIVQARDNFKKADKEDVITMLEGDAMEIMPGLDILYMTRVQKERFFNEEDYVRLKDFYVLDKAKLSLAPSDMLVLHPLPRVNEISVDVDDDPRAVYFKQAQYGVYVRMALILTLLGISVND